MKDTDNDLLAKIRKNIDDQLRNHKKHEKLLWLRTWKKALV